MAQSTRSRGQCPPQTARRTSTIVRCRVSVLRARGLPAWWCVCVCVCVLWGEARRANPFVLPTFAPPTTTHTHTHTHTHTTTTTTTTTHRCSECEVALCKRCARPGETTWCCGTARPPARRRNERGHHYRCGPSRQPNQHHNNYHNGNHRRHNRRNPYTSAATHTSSRADVHRYGPRVLPDVRRQTAAASLRARDVADRVQGTSTPPVCEPRSGPCAP